MLFFFFSDWWFPPLVLLCNMTGRETLLMNILLCSYVLIKQEIYIYKKWLILIDCFNVFYRNETRHTITIFTAVSLDMLDKFINYLCICYVCYNLNIFYSEKYWKRLDSRTSLYIFSSYVSYIVCKLLENEKQKIPHCPHKSKIK